MVPPHLPEDQSPELVGGVEDKFELQNNSAYEARGESQASAGDEGKFNLDTNFAYGAVKKRAEEHQQAM